MNNEPKETAPPPATTLQPHYSVSVEEAVILFTEAGLPRSPRSVRRYCERGHLDATKADGIEGDRYLIDPDSIERRIEELRQQELVSRSDRSRPEPSGHDLPRPDKAGHDQPASKGLEKLEDQIRDLEIANRVKDKYLRILEGDRAKLLDQVGARSEEIGILKTRLELNAGPAPAGNREALETGETDADASRVADETTGQA